MVVEDKCALVWCPLAASRSRATRCERGLLHGPAAKRPTQPLDLILTLVCVNPAPKSGIICLVVVQRCGGLSALLKASGRVDTSAPPGPFLFLTMRIRANLLREKRTHT